MLLISLALVYIVLLISEHIFYINEKEDTAGVITLSLILTLTCFINSYHIVGMIWFIMTLLEYNYFLKNYSDDEN